MSPVMYVMLGLISAFTLGLGAVVLQRNSRSRTNQLFAATAVVLVTWTVLSYMSDRPGLYAFALPLNRVVVAFGMLMATIVIAFAVTFPRTQGPLPWRWRIMLLPGFALAIIAVTTPWIVVSVQPESWGTSAVQGPLYLVMTLWAVAVSAVAIIEIARRYRKAEAYRRAQLKYLYLGLGSFALLTLMFAGILPIATQSDKYAGLEPLAILALMVPTGYAILRHRLLDVSFVVVRAAAYTLLIGGLCALFVAVAERGRDDLARVLGVNPTAWVFLVVLILSIGLRPLEHYIEEWTDRFFYQRTYDPGRLLSEMNLIVASALDLDEMAIYMADVLASEMKLTFAVVVSMRGENLLVASSDRSMHEHDLIAFLPLAGESIILADDFELDSEDGQLLQRHGVRALLPLSMNEERLGVVLLGAKRAGTMYSVQDERFLKVLVSELSIALRTAQLFNEKNRRVDELVALNDLSRALGHDVEFQSALDNVLPRLVEVTEAETAVIMLLGENDEFDVVAAVGMTPMEATAMGVDINSDAAAWLLSPYREPVVLALTDEHHRDYLTRNNIFSAILAPIVYHDRVVGAIGLRRAKNPAPFSEENLRVVTSFTGQLGATVENARLYEDLESTFFGTITALAAAVDAKDPYTFGHSNEVTDHAVAIAHELQLSEEEVQTIRIAATLHDIGKIGIDGEILHKPGKLDEAERKVIETHPTIGADILAPLAFLQEAVPLVLFHHERWGGGGYPSGISGDTIPIGARVISVADSHNAMISDRPYRSGLTEEEAIAELRDNAGTQFDPIVVEAFLRVLAEENALT